MIRTLLVLTGLFSTVILLAEVLAAGVLWSRGHLTPTTLREIRLAIAQPGEAVQEESQETTTAEEISADEVRQARVKRVLDLDSRSHPDFNWPWPVHVTARYELFPEALSIELAMTNLAPHRVPMGSGFHPYFMRHLWAYPDTPRIHLASPLRYPCRDCLPIGPAAPDAYKAVLAGLPGIHHPLVEIHACRHCPSPHGAESP